MTTSQRRSEDQVGEFDAPSSLSENLQDVLVDLIELHLQGKQAHWNLVGTNFRDLHLQLDEIVDTAREATDTIAERMRATLGQPVIIENVVGANGSIGSGRVTRAAADGYTLVLANWNTHVANGAVYQLQYDLMADFEPVALVASNPYLVVTRKSMPANA